MYSNLVAAESDPAFPLLLSNPTTQSFGSQALSSVESVNAENGDTENVVSSLQSTECDCALEDRIISTKASNAAMIDMFDPSMHPQVAESKPTKLGMDKMPVIQVTYIGRPVELVVLILAFPSPVRNLVCYSKNLCALRF